MLWNIYVNTVLNIKLIRELIFILNVISNNIFNAFLNIVPNIRSYTKFLKDDLPDCNGPISQVLSGWNTASFTQ